MAKHRPRGYLGRGLNWEHSAKIFSKCSMKMRTLVDSRRLAVRTARIGTVRSRAVRRRTTVPSLTSAAKSRAGAVFVVTFAVAIAVALPQSRQRT